MVMGPTHAASGAAAWLVTAPTLTYAVTGQPLSSSATLVGAAVCAGSALLPDIDLPGSTVSRSFGPASEALSYGVSGISRTFVAATSSSRDSIQHGGHRTLTHTLLFAVGLGVAVSALTASFGKYAVAIVLFFTLGLAIRGLMGDWAKREGWIGVTIASLIAALVTVQVVPARGWWWLGAAVTIGCILHDLGDMITKQGAPLTAPFYGRSGKRWWEWSTGPLGISAGGLVEYVVIAPLCWVATIFGLLLAVEPDVAHSLWSWFTSSF